MPLLFLAVALMQAQMLPDADPIKPAARGMLQCHQPDTVKRTCRSLAAYRLRKDGQFDNTAEVLLSPSPLVTMTTVTSISVASGMVCGVVRREDIAAAIVSIDGAALNEERAGPVRIKIADSMGSVINRRICTSYAPEGDVLIAKVTVDGVANPAFDQRVIWVAPGDGYRVAP